MALIADILLAAGAFGAAFYCWVLGRRLKRFNNLENGMGGAVAVLSAQVDDLEKSLTSARAAATRSAADLTALTERAEDVRRQLELQMAALHDIVPVQPAASAPPESAAAPAPAPAKPKTEGEPMFIRHRSA
jgi:hypothetical protein